MKSLFLSILLVCVAGSIAYGAPSKKAVVEFVKGMETAVKENNKILKTGDTIAIHDHSLRIRGIKADADKLFVPEDACSFAANSALSLWTNQLLQHQKPSKMGEGFVKRQMQDYRDNLKACKQGLKN